jgi:hypothetical protein
MIAATVRRGAVEMRRQELKRTLLTDIRALEQFWSSEYKKKIGRRERLAYFIGRMDGAQQILQSPVLNQRRTP